MEQLPLVSVIIAAYNEQKNIEKCLLSILKQTYQNIEILVIDDGSKDKTGAIVKEISRKNPKVKYYYQENKGVSAARNKGIDNCHGEWVAFLDADDSYKITAIEKLLETAEITGTSIIQGGLNRGNETECDGKIVAIKSRDAQHILLNYQTQQNNSDIPLDMHLRYSVHGVYGKLIKTDLIGTTRFQERLRLGEDIAFYYELLSKTEFLAIFPKDVYIINVNTDSSTRRLNPLMCNAVYEYIEYMTKYIRCDTKDIDFSISVYNHLKVAMEAYYLHAENKKCLCTRARELKKFISKCPQIKESLKVVGNEKILSIKERILICFLIHNQMLIYLLTITTKRKLAA